MSERGVIAIDRGIFTDDDFADEPFTEREAFMWLVAEASWKNRLARGPKGQVHLRRGEVCHSVRFMAEAWKWSKSRVDRFLKRLAERDMLHDVSRDSQKIYSVKNYNRFQRVGLPERDNDGTGCGTRMGQERDKLETGNTIPNGMDGEPSEIIEFDPKTILFRQGKDWLIKAAGIPDKQARSLIGRWMKTVGEDPAKVLDAFRRCREARVAEPASWITAALKPARPNNPVEQQMRQSF